MVVAFGHAGPPIGAHADRAKRRCGAAAATADWLRADSSRRLRPTSPIKEIDLSQPTAPATPGKLLLKPNDHTLVLIDYQSQMAFAAKSIDMISTAVVAGWQQAMGRNLMCRKCEQGAARDFSATPSHLRG